MQDYLLWKENPTTEEQRPGTVAPIPRPGRLYGEPAPGIDHFRTLVEKGAELIRDVLRGHTTGLAQPMHVIATNIGKIPLMPDYYISGKDGQNYYLRNHKGEKTSIPNMPE